MIYNQEEKISQLKARAKTDVKISKQKHLNSYYNPVPQVQKLSVDKEDIKKTNIAFL